MFHNGQTQESEIKSDREDQVMLDLIHQRGIVLVSKIKQQRISSSGIATFESLESEVSAYLREIAQICNERIKDMCCEQSSKSKETFHTSQSKPVSSGMNPTFNMTYVNFSHAIFFPTCLLVRKCKNMDIFVNKNIF